MDGKDYDWLRFRIHFVCGALLGGVLGACSWLHNWHPGMSLWLMILAFALAVALPSGIWGDRFWEWFLRSLRWW